METETWGPRFELEERVYFQRREDVTRVNTCHFTTIKSRRIPSSLSAHLPVSVMEEETIVSL